MTANMKMDVKYLFPLFWIAMSGGFTVDETGKVFRFSFSEVVIFLSNSFNVV